MDICGYIKDFRYYPILVKSNIYMRKEVDKSEKFYSVFRECVRTARDKDKIYYSDLAVIVGTIPLNTGVWAKKVCKKMDRHGGPMLGAVIVYKNPNSEERPGDGFFKVAYDLGNLDREPMNMSLEEKVNFWRGELSRVYSFFDGYLSCSSY